MVLIMMASLLGVAGERVALRRRREWQRGTPLRGLSICRMLNLQGPAAIIYTSLRAIGEVNAVEKANGGRPGFDRRTTVLRQPVSTEFHY